MKLSLLCPEIPGQGGLQGHSPHTLLLGTVPIGALPNP